MNKYKVNGIEVKVSYELFEYDNIQVTFAVDGKKFVIADVYEPNEGEISNDYYNDDGYEFYAFVNYLVENHGCDGDKAGDETAYFLEGMDYYGIRDELSSEEDE